MKTEWEPQRTWVRALHDTSEKNTINLCQSTVSQARHRGADQPTSKLRSRFRVLTTPRKSVGHCLGSWVRATPVGFSVFRSQYKQTVPGTDTGEHTVWMWVWMVLCFYMWHCSSDGCSGCRWQFLMQGRVHGGCSTNHTSVRASERLITDLRTITDRAAEVARRFINVNAEYSISKSMMWSSACRARTNTSTVDEQ